MKRPHVAIVASCAALLLAFGCMALSKHFVPPVATNKTKNPLFTNDTKLRLHVIDEIGNISQGRDLFFTFYVASETTVDCPESGCFR